MNNKLKTKNLSQKIMAALLISAGLFMAGCTTQNSPVADQGSDRSGDVSKEEALEKIQSVVRNASRGDFQATQVFDGPENLDLYGLVIEPERGPNKMIGWVTKDGNYFLPGPVFDQNGENIAEEYMEQYSGFISNEELADKVKDMGFVAGTSGPILTAFFEPFCGFCNQLFTQINPLVERGEVRVRYLMVGFLRPDSLDRAASIHFADNPQQTLVDWELNPNKDEVQLDEVTDEQRQAITEHAELMFSAGLSGTPALMFCSNGEINKLSGMPGDVESFVSQLSEEGHGSCGE